jgi:hypothetical protein
MVTVWSFSGCKVHGVYVLHLAAPGLVGCTCRLRCAGPERPRRRAKPHRWHGITCLACCSWTGEHATVSCAQLATLVAGGAGLCGGGPLRLDGADSMDGWFDVLHACCWGLA